MLDRAPEAGTPIIRTNVYWWQIAPKRPAEASDPFDPAYRFATSTRWSATRSRAGSRCC